MFGAAGATTFHLGLMLRVMTICVRITAHSDHFILDSVNWNRLLLRMPIKSRPNRMTILTPIHQALAIRIPDQVVFRTEASNVDRATFPSSHSGMESVNWAWPMPA